jgi:hypothetical protein
MATPSQIKAGLNDIAQRIAGERNRLLQAKVAITTAKATLAGFPAQYQTLLADIAALTGNDASVVLAKDERAKLIAEFQALQATATAAETAIASIIQG